MSTSLREALATKPTLLNKTPPEAGQSLKASLRLLRSTKMELAVTK